MESGGDAKYNQTDIFALYISAKQSHHHKKHNPGPHNEPPKKLNICLLVGNDKISRFKMSQ